MIEASIDYDCFALRSCGDKWSESGVLVEGILFMVDREIFVIFESVLFCGVIWTQIIWGCSAVCDRTMCRLIWGEPTPWTPWFVVVAMVLMVAVEMFGLRGLFGVAACWWWSW